MNEITDTLRELDRLCADHELTFRLTRNAHGGWQAVLYSQDETIVGVSGLVGSPGSAVGRLLGNYRAIFSEGSRPVAGTGGR